MKAIVLFSGGLDSTTCLAKAIETFGADQVMALSIYYGQKHEKEIESAKKIVEYYHVWHKTLDMTEIFKGSKCSLIGSSGEEIPEESYEDQLRRTKGEPVSTYVPFRNGLFIAAAVSYGMKFGCDTIYIGIHRDDAAGNAYPDCSVSFKKYMNDAVITGTDFKCHIEAPFVKMTKAEIVAEGLKLGVPYELTWSCYEGGEKACGRCGTCIDRRRAFEANGVNDPVEYEER